MNNPLIEKFYELHPEKKEKPKVIKADEFEGEVTLAQVENAFKKWDSNYIPVTSNLPTPSVATSNTGITKASNTYTTHDIDDTDKSFLQIAEEIKNGNAQVRSMSMEINDVLGCYDGVKKITFEVYLR
jgi:hypothetical protein